jgi:hypothetical protein
MFFFEKKNQKTSAPLRACVASAAPQRKNQSFFASFCSQKEVLPSSVFSLQPVDFERERVAGTGLSRRA